MSRPRMIGRSTTRTVLVLVLTLLGSVVGAAATEGAGAHSLVGHPSVGSSTDLGSGAPPAPTPGELRDAADARGPTASTAGTPIGESVQATLALLNGSLQAGGVTTYNGLGPDGVAYAPTSNQLFVSQVGTDSVSVIDASTWKIVTSIPVGSFPAGVVYDGATGYIYEANAETANLSVINPLTDRAVASIPTPAVNPYQLAYDSTNGYLYVGNAFGDNVSVIDPVTALPVASITIGLYVSDVAFDSSNGEIYATANVANVVGFIDGATNTLLGNLTVGNGPLTLCFDARNGYVYVGNTGASTVTVIDGATDTVVTTFSAYGSEDMLVDPSNTELYVAESNGILEAFDTLTNLSVATMPIGGFPEGIALDGTSGYIFTANRNSNNLSAADPSTNTIVGAIQLGTSPFALADAPSTGTVAVLDAAESTLDVIDRAHHLAGRIPLANGPSSLAYDPGNGHIYVADGGASHIAEVNTSSMQVVHDFAQGAFPNWGAIAYDRATGRLLVTGGGLLAAVDPGTGSVLGTVGVGPGPHALAVDPATGLVFVANGGSADNITLVDGGSMTVVANLSTGAPVSSLAFDLADGEVYAAVPSAGLVLVLNGASGSIVANVTTQSDPVSLSYDPSVGGIWVLDDSYFATPTASPIVGESFWSNWTVSFSATINAAAYDPLSQAPVVISEAAGAVYFLTPAWGYPVGFASSGLPPSTAWQASVGAATLQGSANTLTTSLANGSYAYQISAPSGLVATPSSGVVLVNGSAVEVAITFRPIPASTFPVRFSETGLPAGRPWTVSVNGTVSTALGSDLNLSLVNGTYGYFVGSPAGYGATPADGIVVLAGLSKSISLVFRAIPSNGPPPANNSSNTQRSGTNSTTTVYPATWLWLLTAVVVAEAAALIVLALLLARRPGVARPPSPPANSPPPPGAQGPPGS